MTAIKDWTLLFLLLLALDASSQKQDAGIWFGIKLTTDLTKKLEASISPELRLDENLSRLSGIFSDFELEYKLNKLLFISGAYRFGWRRNNNWLDSRQRFTGGIGAKHKSGDFTFAILSRYQTTGFVSSAENDADLSVSWRNKFSVKFGGLKKTDLSTSFEIFNAAGPFDVIQLTDWRWQAEVERKLSKRRFISAGYMIQQDLSGSQVETDFVFLLGYKYLPDFKKKKKKTEEIPTP